MPLALHLAGSFLAAYRHAVTPKAYLTQLRDETLLDHPSLRGRGTTFSPTGHELHVARTFALSYDRLDPKDENDALALALDETGRRAEAQEHLETALELARVTGPDSLIEQIRQQLELLRQR